MPQAASASASAKPPDVASIKPGLTRRVVTEQKGGFVAATGRSRASSAAAKATSEGTSVCQGLSKVHTQLADAHSSGGTEGSSAGERFRNGGVPGGEASRGAARAVCKTHGTRPLRSLPRALQSHRAQRSGDLSVESGDELERGSGGFVSTVIFFGGRNDNIANISDGQRRARLQTEGEATLGHHGAVPARNAPSRQIRRRSDAVLRLRVLRRRGLFSWHKMDSGCGRAAPETQPSGAD